VAGERNTARNVQCAMILFVVFTGHDRRSLRGNRTMCVAVTSATPTFSNCLSLCCAVVCLDAVSSVACSII